MLHEQCVAEITHNYHMTGSQPQLWWAISLAEFVFSILQSDQPGVPLPDTTAWYRCLVPLPDTAA